MMTNAERYLLEVLAEVMRRHLGPKDDLYWSIGVGLDELKQEDEREETDDMRALQYDQ